MRTKIVFITGTDTGVGKSLTTALMLCHLRASSLKALALKPFCSGSRDDAELLYALQEGDLALDEINPFFFSEPVAPVISARARKTNVSLGTALEQIHSVAAQVEQKAHPKSSPRKAANSRSKAVNYLLIEGSGGLLVPLGEGYTVLDLIAGLQCEVVVVSRNKLGTINHTLLTLRVLGQGLRANRSHPFSRPASVVLTDTAERDLSCRTNPAFLAELIHPTPLVRLPYLGRRSSTPQSVIKNAQKLRNVLNAVLGLK